MAKVEIQYVADVVAVYLADGPKSYDLVKAHCAKLGISRFDLKAARQELGVKTINNGETWLWYVPDPDGEGHA